MNFSDIWNLGKSNPALSRAGLIVAITVSTIGGTWYTYVTEQRIKLIEESEKRNKETADRHASSISEAGEHLKSSRAALRKVSGDLFDISTSKTNSSGSISNARSTASMDRETMIRLHTEIERIDRDLQYLESRLKFGQKLISNKLIKIMTKLCDINSITAIPVEQAVLVEFLGTKIEFRNARKQDIVVLREVARRSIVTYVGLYLGEGEFLLPSNDCSYVSNEWLSGSKWQKMRLVVVRPDQTRLER